MNILDKLGFYGPMIMIGANIYELRNRLFHVFLFIVYIFMNIGINKQLKLWIKQPRPNQYDTVVEVQNDWVEYNGAEKYGMPSGHSMLICFSWMYLWWNTKNVAYLILGGFLIFLTLYQRWKYKKHTVEQLIVGGILGILLAFCAHMATKKWFAKMNYASSDILKSSLDNV